MENLRKVRVRIQSIDAEGGKQLAAALGKLGVRVVKGAAELTVTLVNDYLDARLGELNKRHLHDKTPWLLAQPSGVFPLVGPVFMPGDSACWTCMSDRMRRNREVKALLDRTHARCVSISPLTHSMIGQSAVELAALEIARAIATGLRTALRDHIVSLDLSGSSIVKHFVSKRPQCPSCGAKKLYNPRREPTPLQLGTGGKLVMTSGGYRSVSPSATVARNRKHVSPLTGVVSKLERINVDLPLNTNWLATHNFAPRPETVQELRAGLDGNSYGKGSTAEQGEASALMEAIERYSGVYQGDEIRVTRRFGDFPPGDAIAPNDVMLFSEAQFSRRDTPRDQRRHAPDAASVRPFGRDGLDAGLVVARQVLQISADQPVVLFLSAARRAFMADSNGCAAGNTLEEAIVQGFLELVERDSYAIWWYNRLLRPELDLSQFDDPYIRDLRVQLAETGRKTWMLDVTNDLGIPSFVTISHWIENGQEPSNSAQARTSTRGSRCCGP